MPRSVAPVAGVERSIHVVRGHRIMIDEDLARLYEVPTKSLNLAVKRNEARFPTDFRFQLTTEEAPALRFQSETSKGRGGRRYLPWAFTQEGVAMLSGVLNSPRAIAVNVEIMRAFVKLRQAVALNAELAKRLAVVEARLDQHWWAPRSAIVVAAAVPPSLTTVTQQAELRQRLAAAAKAQIGVTLAYDPAYVRLAYPGGDVPIDRGVCSDVVVRACRTVGWDLQRLLHEDMTAHFAVYPTRWGLRQPDANIDHRRVANLMTWFERQGWSRAITATPTDYLAGDIVAWDLGRGLTHIGVVVPDGQGRPQIVHNIGQGAQQEAVLFAWPQLGHYRITGDPAAFRAPAASPHAGR